MVAMICQSQCGSKLIFTVNLPQFTICYNPLKMFYKLSLHACKIWTQTDGTIQSYDGTSSSSNSKFLIHFKLVNLPFCLELEIAPL